MRACTLNQLRAFVKQEAGPGRAGRVLSLSCSLRSSRHLAWRSCSAARKRRGSEPAMTGAMPEF